MFWTKYFTRTEFFKVWPVMGCIFGAECWDVQNSAHFSENIGQLDTDSV